MTQKQIILKNSFLVLISPGIFAILFGLNQGDNVAAGMFVIWVCIAVGLFKVVRGWLRYQKSRYNSAMGTL